jgi:hypothetical protein
LQHQGHRQEQEEEVEHQQVRLLRMMAMTQMAWPTNWTTFHSVIWTKAVETALAVVVVG